MACRCIGPLFAGHGHPVNPPSASGRLRNTGLLVINMVADDRLLDVIRERKLKGLPTVCEISDDFESFPAHLPSHGFYSRSEIQTTLRELIRQSTAVQYSSSHLARKYGHLNPNHALFLNQLNTLPPLSPRSDQTLTIGWSGSLSHLEDARKLAAMLAHWPNRQKIRLAVMAAPDVVNVFREQGLAVEETAPGNMAAYFSFLERLDIGIAVIGSDEFSAGRSDGKFLEYASHGVVAVCSRAGSYAQTVREGETGYLFGTEAELFAILDGLIQNHELRNRIRTQALPIC